ncbi:MAG: SUMF1/EgtB/PvdO family nonheme iron enzyme [Planctomycetota bacterium]|jgi:formylglycine-generating enzyme required for sulfatase activity
MPEKSDKNGVDRDEKKKKPDTSFRFVKKYLDDAHSGEETPSTDSLSEEEFEKQFFDVFERVRKDLFDDEDLTQDEDEEAWTLGDFKILRKIGAGGMATVYEAEQLSLRRRVALKVLPSHLRFSDKAIKKFHREAEAGGRSSHPGIVSIYAVGDHEGNHYIAQELVEGGKTLSNLLDAMHEEKSLPTGYFRVVARLISEAADALHHAHDTGVIHRDVKPSNMLLTRRGRLKLTDFGLAKVEDALALSRTGEFAGTPYYMSPEQVAGKKVHIDPKTDIFSLGVSLYELLTLERPFTGDTSHDVLKKVLFFDPLDPRRINSRVPVDLAVICMKAIEKKPDDRYPDMESFSHDLKRYLSGEVITAKPVGPAKRFWKRAKRNPALSAALGVAGFAVLLLILYIPWTMARLADERDKAREAEEDAIFNSELAEARYQEIIRLSDVALLSQLLAQEKELYPACAEKIPEMESWLLSAEELAARLPTHRATLEALRASSEPVRQEGETVSWKIDDPGRQWQHDTLAELVVGIEAFCDEKSGKKKNVEDRLEFARTVWKRSIEDPKKDWEKTIAAIADEASYPHYNGLLIEPQLGLVPLGCDADSGLFEFAHLQSGEIPTRGPDGKFMMSEESGMVFVLIPGGTFRMGAETPSEGRSIEDPNVDPMADPLEGPVHTVTVPPFFLSKYEMSQGQWLRCAGENPSQYDPVTIWENWEWEVITLNHPVEFVDFDDCALLCSRLELRLPFEAEWEYAARGGTTTVWWTGNEKESLIGAVNLVDKFYKDNGGRKDWTYETWLDDGYAHHAPVHCYRPNPFGLHNVCGNVWEWCQDTYHRGYDGAPVDGSAWETGDGSTRVGRGGGFDTFAKYTRSAFRIRFLPGDRAGYIGIRPARSID